MARKPTMGQAPGMRKGVYEYRGWLLAKVWGTFGPKWHAHKWNEDLAERMEFDEVTRANVRAVIDHFEDTGEFRVQSHGYAEKSTPGTVHERYYGEKTKRGYKGWKITKEIGFTGPRRGQHTWYEATKGGEVHKHHKLKTKSYATKKEDSTRQSNPRTIARVEKGPRRVT
jgi:hypothetical protein